ncbi:streptomycin biosynthesis protein [Streptomyces katsurahamanus]|uniref:Streptomycin biosynthesis protein n=2 Tax=Streptomyces katsurahamanus TaxID=2577098 RepID=A0ABW9NMX4_9ACTN|nr:streptomycin biosynthesis protein [Streptomyces katsurahamanus]
MLEQRLEKCPIRAVPIDVLKLVDSPRVVGEDDGHIRALAESEEDFPPIVVDAGTMRVIDGAHRVRAAALRGRSEIRARLYTAVGDEAFVLAVLLNSRHGLPLTTADRRAAAARIMVGCPQWSDRRIARLAGLSPTTVAGLRNRSTVRNEQSNTRVGADGRTRPVSGAAGRLQARELLLGKPEMSLRELARAAGISASTAADVRARLKAGDDPLPPRLRGTAPAPRRIRGDAGAPVTALPHPAPPHHAPSHSAPPHHPPSHLASPNPAPSERALLLQRLRNDPSLRFNESGRSLLRWLSQHPAHSAELAGIAENVPAHCASTAAALIRANLEVWAAYAEELQRRADSVTGSSDALCMR